LAETVNVVASSLLLILRIGIDTGLPFIDEIVPSR
jgi:hypothetical protein